MTYWQWTASTKIEWDPETGKHVGGEEDIVVCEICLETWGFYEHGYYPDEASIVKAIEEHVEQAHQIQPKISPFEMESVFDVRERCIIGYEYDHRSSDCDGPLESSGSRRLQEGMTWSHHIGREFTSYPPDEIATYNEGLAFDWGGATEEGYSGTHIKAIFSHEAYKLNEPDRRRDVFAESGAGGHPVY